MASTKRMTQTEIISHLADKTGMKKVDAKEFFNTLASLATSEVKKNGEFTLPGFGKLVKAHRKAREGRNPATGKPIKIPAKTTVKAKKAKEEQEVDFDAIQLNRIKPKKVFTVKANFKNVGRRKPMKYDFSDFEEEVEYL